MAHIVITEFSTFSVENLVDNVQNLDIIAVFPQFGMELITFSQFFAN
jgi:hypothetical protein